MDWREEGREETHLSPWLVLFLWKKVGVLLSKTKFLLSCLRMTGMGIGVVIKKTTKPFSPTDPIPVVFWKVKLCFPPHPALVVMEKMLEVQQGRETPGLE